MDQHASYMRRAIELSEKGMDSNAGGPFGALIVRDGKVIGEGFNRVTSTFDPSAHGEVTAIRDAAKRIQNPWLEGADLYTSCEPCPMCLSTSLWARIDSIRYAATRWDAADIGFDDEEFYRELQIKPRGKIITVESMGEEMRQLALEVMRKWPEKHMNY